jgi:hypothetical protein
MGLLVNSRDDTGNPQIRRKVVGSGQAPKVKKLEADDAAPLTQQEHLRIISDANHSIDEVEQTEQPPPMPPRPQISLDTNLSDLQISPRPTPTSANGSNLAISSASDDYFSLSAISRLPSAVSTPISESPPTPTALEKIKSDLKKGYDATTHFAGGLLSHPSESTKHFSILRHSNGLVFYRGSSTSLPISIFSDAPLPTDQKIFLQSKGWSGNTGMAAKAFLGRNGYWIDVTPSIQATASQLDPVNEKAWQRDITHFLKKAENHVRKTHILRQTCLVRIPIEAGDGYFRIVLCTGQKKKVLCPSPVFRVLSTSFNPSSMKGSSLSTLPLEIGAMVLTTAAKVTAMNMVAPVKLVAMAPVQRFIPGSLAKHVGKVVYGATGAGKRVDATVDDANARYEQLHDTLFTELGGAEATPDSGPVSPYPLEFLAAVDAGNGGTVDGLDVPSMNLVVADENIAHRLHGFYFGWAKIVPKIKKSRKPDPNEIPTSWYQVVISATITKPSEQVRLHFSHKHQRVITITLIEDTEGASFVGTNVEVKIMGFIRACTSPDDSSNTSTSGVNPDQKPPMHRAQAMTVISDMAMAQASLDRPAWGPERVLEKVQNGDSEGGKKGTLENVKTRYAHTRMTVSRQVDRVPFYKAGLRVGADRIRDKDVGNGGIFVVRD